MDGPAGGSLNILCNTLAFGQSAAGQAKLRKDLWLLCTLVRHDVADSSSTNDENATHDKPRQF
jgi:hypothetical protein